MGTAIFVIVLLALFIWTLTKLRLSTFLYIASFNATVAGIGLTQWNDGIGTMVVIAGVVLGVLAYLRGRSEKQKAAVAQAAANR